jgi:hypothetical protein
MVEEERRGEIHPKSIHNGNGWPKYTLKSPSKFQTESKNVPNQRSADFPLFDIVFFHIAHLHTFREPPAA